MKDLILNVSKESYVNHEGKTVEFTKIFVIVNGIQLQLKPADSTVRQVIEQHYNLGKE